MNTAGIDVGSKSHCLVLNKQGKTSQSKTYSNDAKGHNAIINLLKKSKIERVCIEATGVYHVDLAVALHHANLNVMVLNPKAARHYIQAMMGRSKTDPQDALMLSEYAQHMPFNPWRCPKQEYLSLRALSRRLAALTKQKTQLKNQLHALSATEQTPNFIVDDIVLNIEQLEEHIRSLHNYALKLIEQDDSLKEAMHLLLSVKGIAHTSAIQLMGECLVLPEDMTGKQWVAMAGLDPRHHQSGTSIHKKSRISKAGNRYLRMALYMPALSASRHDPYVNGFYRHLIENRGLKKIQAACAVMRKLLLAIHGMLKTRSAFDNTRFFNLEKCQA